VDIFESGAWAVNPIEGEERPILLLVIEGPIRPED
jgi:hypothetical protein